MDEAIEIADELLKDKLVVLLKIKQQIKKTYATKKGDFEDGDPFILINENSASASEILAGAVQIMIGELLWVDVLLVWCNAKWILLMVLQRLTLLITLQADQFKSRIQMAMKSILKNQNRF
jgi:hypothetical protein